MHLVISSSMTSFSSSSSSGFVSVTISLSISAPLLLLRGAFWSLRAIDSASSVDSDLFTEPPASDSERLTRFARGVRESFAVVEEEEEFA